MKRPLLVLCFAVLAASPASALNPHAQDWLGERTLETRCSKPGLDPDTQIRQCIDALNGEGDHARRLALLADLGIAYEQAGRFNMAMDCYAQVLAEQPDDWQTLLARGFAYLQMGRPKDAQADAEHILRLGRNGVGVRVLRAQALAAQGAFDAAIADADAAIALMPDSPVGYVLRGNTHARAGQSALAIADFDKAIALGPVPRLYNNRCFERAKLGSDLALALADCDKALEAGADADTLDSRGFVHFRMGDYKAAIADLDAALDKKRGLASSLFVRGVAKLKTGDGSGGADIAAAKAIDPRIADTYAKYGVTR